MSRRAHRWLALIVGVQALIWTLTGLYMTAVHIDVIHGDHLVRPAPAPAVRAQDLLSPVIAARTVDQPQSVRLSTLRGRPVYVVAGKTGQTLVDARTGASLPKPSREEIAAIASERFAGEGTLVSLQLLSQIPPEIRGRQPPIWRAEYGGWNKPTLYLSPDTGELIARRHELWRVFDFVWMLHIMDYEERENVNNLLLRVMTLLALATVLAGAWLLLHAFPRKRRKAAR